MTHPWKIAILIDDFRHNKTAAGAEESSADGNSVLSTNNDKGTTISRNFDRFSLKLKRTRSAKLKSFMDSRAGNGDDRVDHNEKAWPSGLCHRAIN
jgi:hypothetical protein